MQWQQRTTVSTELKWGPVNSWPPIFLKEGEYG